MPSRPMRYARRNLCDWHQRVTEEVLVRSNFTKDPRRVAVAVLALALAVPLMNGCSQLGIAKTEDLTATESRLDQRLDTVEKNTGDMQQTLGEITASLDTLNTRFARASEWLHEMNLDTISKDAKSATEAATLAETRSRNFLEHYLEWLKAQYELLGQQIATLDEKMKAPAKDAPAEAESTEETPKQTE
jgi:hypothetical protein